MQPCLCLSDSACLDMEGGSECWGGWSSFYTPAGDQYELDKPSFSSSSLSAQLSNCELYIRQLSADVEGSHYKNKWFLFQPGSWVNCSLPFYFMAELVGLKLSSNLSSPFPRILWGYWILWSLTVCTCAFAALCFTLLILTRPQFVSSEQAGRPVCPDLCALPSVKIPSK